jgi:hypothetical protein
MPAYSHAAGARAVQYEDGLHDGPNREPHTIARSLPVRIRASDNPRPSDRNIVIPCSLEDAPPMRSLLPGARRRGAGPRLARQVAEE